MTAGSMAFLPLGYAVVGPLASWLGAEAVLAGGAALLLASLPLLLSVRSVRRPKDLPGASDAGFAVFDYSRDITIVAIHIWLETLRWRRRESNPRREPTVDDSEEDSDLADRPAPDSASGEGHKVGQEPRDQWDDGPLGSA